MSTEQLWLNTEQKLRRYLMKNLQDASQVDDLLQSIFIKMRNQIQHLRKLERADAWLFKITRSTLMDHFREQKKLTQLKQEIPNWNLPDPSDNEKTALLASWIPEAIKLLPEKYREAVYLTEIKGLSQKELAEHLGISYSGAKSRVQRGREKLKEIILDCCDVAADKYGNIIEYKSRESTCEEC